MNLEGKLNSAPLKIDKSIKPNEGSVFRYALKSEQGELDRDLREKRKKEDEAKIEDLRKKLIGQVEDSREKPSFKVHTYEGEWGRVEEENLHRLEQELGVKLEKRDISLADENIGFLTLGKNEQLGYFIQTIQLDSEQRGKGIGKEIYMHLNEESLTATGKPLRSSPFKDMGAHSIGLWDKLVSEGLAIKGENEYSFV